MSAPVPSSPSETRDQHPPARRLVLRELREVVGEVRRVDALERVHLDERVLGGRGVDVEGVDQRVLPPRPARALGRRGCRTPAGLAEPCSARRRPSGPRFRAHASAGGWASRTSHPTSRSCRRRRRASRASPRRRRHEPRSAPSSNRRRRFRRRRHPRSDPRRGPGFPRRTRGRFWVVLIRPPKSGQKFLDGATLCERARRRGSALPEVPEVRGGGARQSLTCQLGSAISCASWSRSRTNGDRHWCCPGAGGGRGSAVRRPAARTLYWTDVLEEEGPGGRRLDRRRRPVSCATTSRPGCMGRGRRDRQVDVSAAVDVLVNNAGIYWSSRCSRRLPTASRRCSRSNLIGAVLGSRPSPSRCASGAEARSSTSPRQPG